MNRNVFEKIIALFAVSLLVVCGALGQAGTTSIHGVVTDKSGAVIAAAKVTLLNPGQGLQREVNSNESGEFEFVALQPGTYSLVVEAS